VRTRARDALVGLGWKPSIARAAVDEAWSHVGSDAALEPLIREALRRCPTKG
jgi:Holliday junction resolvasome RuvABC DNA-binding subunit